MAFRFSDEAETPVDEGGTFKIKNLVKCVACKPGYRPVLWETSIRFNFCLISRQEILYYQMRTNSQLRFIEWI